MSNIVIGILLEMFHDNETTPLGMLVVCLVSFAITMGLLALIIPVLVAVTNK